MDTRRTCRQSSMDQYQPQLDHAGLWQMCGGIPGERGPPWIEVLAADLHPVWLERKAQCCSAFCYWLCFFL